ncbi:FecCD family ABC transporter permease [Membranihabitans maritimus]|uniref:FecCD family ABC transporter permease n=1 Tax=Membranihabitans maritimus TaxID=2904244 RepID=UPI001F190DBB|nr:iron ABC transporter permease [Membranihabitans maritimus]
MNIKANTVLVGMVVLLLAVICFSLFVGAYSVPASDIIKSFKAALVSSGKSQDELIGVNTFLLFQIRLPRILLSGITGAGLAITGAAIQGLFRNPLADPSLIGITNGAMLFAVFALVMMGSIMAFIPEFLQQSVVAIFAFGGSIISTYIVYFLSQRGGKTFVVTMLLAGIALSALAAAVSGIFIYLSDEQQLRDITFWTLGSFSGASWGQLFIAAPVILLGSFALDRFSVSLNAILLGENEAEYLGVDVEKVKSGIILLTSLVVGVCIAMSGIIGFVGLIIPHFIRILKGADYRFLMKASALGGAIFMILADDLARTIIAPAELPIGILSALIGGPFFLWLLMRTNQERLMI